MADKFGFEKVAITLRTSISASDNDWAGMLYDGENYCFSKSYHLHIVDRVGGGDSFGGGLIYAILNGKTTQEAIEFAVAASALKHSVEGDYNRVSVAESKARRRRRKRKSAEVIKKRILLNNGTISSRSYKTNGNR